MSCLDRARELERAEKLFDQLSGNANDLGLVAEEIDTADGELLGNFLQAFSHIRLIAAAWEIDRPGENGRSRSSSGPGGRPRAGLWLCQEVDPLSMWLFWFLLGVALIAVETLVAFTLYAGAVALGAFPAAIVAALGASVEVQVAVFAAGAAFSLVVLRPIARRQLQTQGARTGTDALISARATVLERVDGDHGVVRIRGGDVWSARPMSPDQTFDEGAQVVVRKIKGVFVLVADPGAGDAG